MENNVDGTGKEESKQEWRVKGRRQRQQFKLVGFSSNIYYTLISF
jgi:hypothetical protein